MLPIRIKAACAASLWWNCCGFSPVAFMGQIQIRVSGLFNLVGFLVALTCMGAHIRLNSIDSVVL